MPVAPRAVSAWPSNTDRSLRSSAAAGSGDNATGGLAFPRLARVLKPAQYQQVLRRGRRVGRGEWFQLLYAAESVDLAPTGQARLGLIVGKRNAPLAVSRNAIKRVWREAFRQRRAQLPAGDYVVRLQARIPELSLTQLKARAAAEALRLLLQAESAARPASTSRRPKRRSEATGAGQAGQQTEAGPEFAGSRPSGPEPAASAAEPS